jgi:hypothetical protein
MLISLVLSFKKLGHNSQIKLARVDFPADDGPQIKITEALPNILLFFFTQIFYYLISFFINFRSKL